LSSKSIRHGALTAGPGSQNDVLVDHDHEPVAGPDLESVWDRQACSRILLAELAELLPERTGSDLLAIVVCPFTACGWLSCTPAAAMLISTAFPSFAHKWVFT
jgi:hypothetical protein